jgi:hypothetical protein
VDAILLDRVGDATSPDGYQEVNNEVGFLRHALDEGPLLIRGKHLCDWAQAFYSARQIVTEETHSPVREIQRAMPGLSDELATDLYRQFDPQEFTGVERPLSPARIAKALHPGTLWDARTSLEHAAEWLLWLCQMEPSPGLQATLEYLIKQWQQQAGSRQVAYTATDPLHAQKLLESWLYIQPGQGTSDLGEFPLKVPDGFMSRARAEWSKQIVKTSGAFFHELVKQPIPGSLKRLAANEMYKFLRQNPDKLNHALYASLEPFLSLDQQAELSKSLPPEPPPSIPAGIPEVLTWFGSSYLPYRRWQSRHGDETATKLADAAARDFAVWYLDNYPEALMGGALRDYLSFRQLVSQQGLRDGAATLLIVADGLHADDAEVLKHSLEEKTQRLTALQDSYVFAPLPTVTAFCKDSLLRGVPPSEMGRVGYLGEVLPEKKHPSDRVESLKPGDLLVWSVMEPDHTYHGRNTYDSLKQDVRSALENIAGKVADIVERVSPELVLRIIVTTDHGRLLATARRAMEVPAGMESHGRASWGPLQTSFGKTGYVIEDDVVHLHGERFGLPSDVGEAMVMIGPVMFKTNDAKSGSERFPHGGLYPEEVIVPWIVLERDWKQPELDAAFEGEAMAGTRGLAAITLSNFSEVALRPTQLELALDTGRKTFSLDAPVIGPKSTGSLQLELASWPTEAQLANMTASVTVALPTGRTFEVTVDVQLTSRELYQRDDILGGLDI